MYLFFFLQSFVQGIKYFYLHSFINIENSESIFWRKNFYVFFKHCIQVSKNWYSLANKNEVWKDKCGHIEIKVPVPSNPNWKTVYRDNVYLAKNWESGACRVLDLKGHSDQ